MTRWAWSSSTADLTMSDSGPAPPSHVLEAFGVPEPARPLPGGQGGSWRAGGVVLKQEAVPGFPAWLASHLDRIPQHGFRLAAPIPTRDGAWVHDGWAATEFLVGRPPSVGAEAPWGTILGAGRAFHRAVAHLAPAPFVFGATSWWGRADRVAWGEETCRLAPCLEAVAARLRPALAPLGDPQLVHGDLTGNVLLAEGHEP